MTRRDLLSLPLAAGLLYAAWHFVPRSQREGCTTMLLLSSEKPICDGQPWPHQCTPDCDESLHRDIVLTDVSGPALVAYSWRADSPVVLLDAQPHSGPTGLKGFRVVFVLTSPPAAAA